MPCLNNWCLFTSLSAGAGVGELRQELKATRLAELQWRFLNSSMEAALAKRTAQVRALFGALPAAPKFLST